MKMCLCPSLIGMFLKDFDQQMAPNLEYFHTLGICLIKESLLGKQGKCENTSQWK